MLMAQRAQIMQTSYERDGYDGVRGNVQWWFEAWGSGAKATWNVRSEVGRPPSPAELAHADYIVFAFRKGRHVTYKTRVGGLDL